MFKFLKDKLKSAVDKFTKTAQQQAEDVEDAVPARDVTEDVVPNIKDTNPEQRIALEQRREDIIFEDVVEPSKESTKKPIPAFAGQRIPQRLESSVEDVEDDDDDDIHGQVVAPPRKPSVPVQESVSADKNQIEPEPEPGSGQDLRAPPAQSVPLDAESVTEHVSGNNTRKSPQKTTPDAPPKKAGFFRSLFGGKDSSVQQDHQITEPQQDTTPDTEKPSLAPRQVAYDAQTPQLKQQADPKKTTAPEKKSILERFTQAVTKKKISEEKFEELFFDLEVTLLENNVALQVIEKIKDDLKKSLVDTPLDRGQIDKIIMDSLHNSVDEVLSIPGFDLLQRIQSSQRPYVIAIIGVNGSGKTTTLAKLANLLKKNNLSVVIAASDTYRAAAIQQLEHHALALGIKLIKHDYGADPSAVAFDAVAHAKAKAVDVVLIDTAGRLHDNKNLMAELEKLIRVAKPDLKIFVGESITGNDCVFQATTFDQRVGIDAIMLAKADVDDKGGAALSVSYVTKKPILYLGTGQTYDDLEPFSKEKTLENLGL